MLRALLIGSLLLMAAVLAARWWFAVRLLTGEGRRVPDRSRAPTITAADLGRDLRDQALAEWHRTDPKAARARAAALRFGIAVPPLALLVGVFAMIVGKIPIIGLMLVFTTALLLSTTAGLLSLPKEWSAIARATRTLPQPKLPREDLELIAACARAHAFHHSIPPILRHSLH
jgi:hypothetical protein